MFQSQSHHCCDLPSTSVPIFPAPSHPRLSVPLADTKQIDFIVFTPGKFRRIIIFSEICKDFCCVFIRVIALWFSLLCAAFSSLGAKVTLSSWNLSFGGFFPHLSIWEKFEQDMLIYISQSLVFIF